MPSSNQRQPARQQQQQNAPAQRQQQADPWEELNSDLSRNQAMFAKLLGCDRTDDHRAIQFITMCYHAVWSKPDLIEADRDSLLLAFAESAVVGLSLNPTAKEGYIEIRSGRARFGAQYQGITKLIRMHNDVDFIHAGTVRRGDHWSEFGGSDPRLEHVLIGLEDEPEQYGEDSAILATYAVIKLKGATRATHEVARRRDIDAARAMSKGPAWNSWFERMARKLPIKRLANTHDISGKARMAISIDESDTLVSEGVRQVFGDHMDIQAPATRGLAAPRPKDPDKLNALMTASGPASETPTNAG